MQACFTSKSVFRSLKEPEALENEIDRLAAEIWKINDKELEEIKHSLRII